MEKYNFTPYKSLQEDISYARKQRLNAGTSSLSYGIDILDDAFVCIDKHDVIVLTGESGKGKTETALSIAMHNARLGKNVLVFPLESYEGEMGDRVEFKILTDLFYSDPSRTKNEWPRFIEWVDNRQNHLFSKYIDRADEIISQMPSLRIRYADDQYGIKEYERDIASIKGDVDLIVLDHLHYFNLTGKDENREYKDILKKIRLLTRDSSIPVILNCHIRKQDNQRQRDPVPHKDDIHGSSDIFKIATKAIIMAPARDLIKTNIPNTTGTFFRLAKCRKDGSLDNFIAALTFNFNTNRYESSYAIGHFEYEKGIPRFVAEDNPRWAKRAKVEDSWRL